jgi:hypothetical protein
MAEHHEDETAAKERPRLGRRAFLRAGAAAAAAGAALFRAPASRAFHEVEKGKSSIPMNPADAALCEDADDTSEFPPPAPPPGKEPKIDARPLSRRDENTETAFMMLWQELALGAAVAGSSDIEWPAIQYAVSNGRRRVYEEAANDPAAFAGYYEEHAAEWRDVGTAAAQTATSGKIEPGIPRDLGKRDRATELVGLHCWFRFVVGVASKSAPGVPKTIPPTVIPYGRHYSRNFLWQAVKNREVYSVWKGNRYDEWPFRANGECGLLAGKRAARLAHGEPAISDRNFTDAWREVHDSMLRYRARRLERNAQYIFADGCG